MRLVLTGFRAGGKEVVFPVYENEQAMAEQRPWGTYHVSVDETGIGYRYGANGMNEGLIVIPSKEDTQQVVVTSNPIDIFLHRQENQDKHTKYVFACGNSSNTMKSLVDLLDKHDNVTLLTHSNEIDVVQERLKGRDFTIQLPQEAVWHQLFDASVNAINQAMQQDYEQEDLAQRQKRMRRRGMRYSMAIRPDTSDYGDD